LGASVGGLFHFRRTAIDTRAQSSRLAEFGGRGMSFNICRGTLGSFGNVQSSNKSRQPAHHRHELLVVEKEIEPDRQRDYAEKQRPHIGISPLQYVGKPL
jgi:hypothetical protein